jgi:hypothetical protein
LAAARIGTVGRTVKVLVVTTSDGVLVGLLRRNEAIRASRTAHDGYAADRTYECAQ